MMSGVWSVWDFEFGSEPAFKRTLAISGCSLQHMVQYQSIATHLMSSTNIQYSYSQ